MPKSRRRWGVSAWSLLLSVIVIFWVPVGAHAAPLPAPPSIQSRAAILVDLQTGAILYEKRAFAQMDPASLTKMMTALVVLSDNIPLDRTVTISPRAARTGGSRFHVQTGQQYTVRDLLHGLLLPSGNDAAVALAEADAGSVGRFVAEMNVMAQKVGAFNTQFENPNGLTAPGHYSSAYDLSLIARAGLRNPVFRQIVRTTDFKVSELTRNRERTIHNSNRLLYEFPGTVGVKTGTTSAAGKCLVAAAERGDQGMLAVVLNSHNRWGDASRLLAWGFEHWHTAPVLTAGRPVWTLPVVDGRQPTVGVMSDRTVWVTLPADTPAEWKLATPTKLSAPVRERQTVGTVTVLSPVQPPQQATLVAARTVPKKPAVQRLWRFFSRFLAFFNYRDGAG